MDSIKVFAPGTVANVACGFDVIGLALDAPGDEMILRRSAEPGIRITAIHGADLPLDPARNVAGVAVQALLQKYDQPDVGIEIEIFKKYIPAAALAPVQPAAPAL